MLTHKSRRIAKTQATLDEKQAELKTAKDKLATEVLKPYNVPTNILQRCLTKQDTAKKQE